MFAVMRRIGRDEGAAHEDVDDERGDRGDDQRDGKDRARIGEAARAQRPLAHQHFDDGVLGAFALADDAQGAVAAEDQGVEGADDQAARVAVAHVGGDDIAGLGPPSTSISWLWPSRR